MGKKFRDSVLSLGGSASPEKIFRTFRGRGATTKALIRHCGLTNNNSGLISSKEEVLLD